MKRVFVILTLVLCFLTSCNSSTDDCIQDRLDEGHTYDTARELCEEARDDLYAG